MDPTPISGNAAERSEKGSVPAASAQPIFDSGIWELDNAALAHNEEEELDCMRPPKNDQRNDDEYADEEERIFHGGEVQYKSYREERPGRSIVDPYDFVYRNLPKKHHVLRKVKSCQFCFAKRFLGEGKSFCCRQDRVKIHIADVPDELRHLFTSQDDQDAKYFRKNISYFNSHISFTSLGAKLDRRYNTLAGSGVYTFRVHGSVYHRLDQLVPGKHGPRHMQLYFYDTDETSEHRVLTTKPYVRVFKRLGSVPNLDEYRIELNTDINVDQRRYNAPTVSQVAAIWENGTDPRKMFQASIMVCGLSERPQYIKAFYGCYYPLSYPLFFPNGEAGWNKRILYDGADDERHETVRTNSLTGDIDLNDGNIDDVHDYQYGDDPSIADHGDGDGEEESEEGKTGASRIYVVAREYYCYKLYIRPDEFNVLFHGGRLLQNFLLTHMLKSNQCALTGTRCLHIRRLSVQTFISWGGARFTCGKENCSP